MRRSLPLIVLFFARSPPPPVLLIFPDRDLSTIDAGRDGEYYTRAAKK